MKVELTALGPDNSPYLLLTGQCIIDAVALGSLSEKCASQGISYSSNTDVLTDDTAPYVSLQLTAVPAAVIKEARPLSDKFKENNGKTT
jgi:hypothetical protein